MYLATLPIDHAVGHILRHNLSDAAGHKALPKGRRLQPADLAVLRELGLSDVRVAVLEPGDVHEDEAARRLGAVIRGPGLRATDAVHSRVNLLAEVDGVIDVAIETLLAINAIDGLTVATLPAHTLARARRRVATIKVIPFAVREEAIAQAESIGQSAAGGVIQLRPLRQLRVGVVLVGSAAARPRIERAVYPAIEGRIVELGSRVLGMRYTPPDEWAIAGALRELTGAGAEMLIAAGETSIMDRDDVTPQGIRLAGGQIEHYGAPVEPGNLLLLGYLGEIAVIGAPGCVRSRDTNIVDLILPRLLAGEHVTGRDIIALGHGGLLG